MKKTIVIPLVAGLFIVIVIGTGIALSIKNKDQLAKNNAATSTSETSTPSPSPSTDTSTTPDPTPTPTPTPTPPPAATTGAYKDGTFSANGSYQTPEDTTTVKVEVTVKSSVITAVSVTKVSGVRDSSEYITKFNSGISGVVSGKSLDSNFSVSQVNGLSLTGSGFIQALESIRTQAKA